MLSPPASCCVSQHVPARYMPEPCSTACKVLQHTRLDANLGKHGHGLLPSMQRVQHMNYALVQPMRWLYTHVLLSDAYFARAAF
jgi:hypothetical protein